MHTSNIIYNVSFVHNVMSIAKYTTLHWATLSNAIIRDEITICIPGGRDLRIFLQHTVPASHKKQERAVVQSYRKRFQEYSYSILSQLLVKGKRRQLSKQTQPAVVGWLLHCNNSAQIVSTFPASKKWRLNLPLFVCHNTVLTIGLSGSVSG